MKSTDILDSLKKQINIYRRHKHEGSRYCRVFKDSAKPIQTQ